MKKLFAGLCLFAGCAAMLNGGEYTLKIFNRSNGKLNKFPVIAALSELGGAINAQNCSVQVFDAAKKAVPAQLDDMNRNGKADEADEITLLADLAPGENVFTIKLLAGKFPAAAEAPKRALYLTADNGIVKVEQNKLKLQQRIISRLNNGKYERIAAHFVQEFNLDKSWKWYLGKESEAVLISAGAVRKTIRFNLIRENRESGKKLQVINDLHIFAGRGEILCVSKLINKTPGQLIQINRVNQGFYDAAIGGKAAPETDRFTGISAKTEAVSGTLASGSYNYRSRTGKSPVWMDLCRPGKGGMGYVITDVKHFDSCCIVYQAPRKIMRFSWLYCPKNLVLWPEKSLDLRSWLVIHGGNTAEVKDFAAKVNAVTIRKP